MKFDGFTPFGDIVSCDTGMNPSMPQKSTMSPPLTRATPFTCTVSPSANLASTSCQRLSNSCLHLLNVSCASSPSLTLVTSTSIWSPGFGSGPDSISWWFVYSLTGNNPSHLKPTLMSQPTSCLLTTVPVNIWPLWILTVSYWSKSSCIVSGSFDSSADAAVTGASAASGAASGVTSSLRSITSCWSICESNPLLLRNIVHYFID